MFEWTSDENTAEAMRVSSPLEHHKRLVSGLWHLLQTSRGVDCSIQWGGHKTRAHRFILDIFLSPENLGVVDVPSQPNDTPLDSLLEFLYKGSVDVTPQQLPQLMQLAKEFNFTMLVNALESKTTDINVPATFEKVPEAKEMTETADSEHGIPMALQMCETQFEEEGSCIDSRMNLLKREAAPETTKPKRKRLKRLSDDTELRETVSEMVVSDNDISTVFQLCETLFDCKEEKPKLKRKHLKPEATKHRVLRRQRSSGATPSRITMSEPMRKNPDHRPFKCDICGKAFKRRFALKEHSIFIHKKMPAAQEVKQKIPHDPNGVKQFNCEVCGKSFKRRFALKEHTRVHSGEKPYKCTECPKSFALAGGLKLHIRSHTGERPYECKECGKRLSSRSSYNNHSRIHSDQRPYQCDVCGEAFVHSGSLLVHALRHGNSESEQKPFPCELCEMRFTTMPSLKNHLISHSGEKAFVCEKCGKGFGYPQCLKKHLQTRACGRKVGRQPKSLTHSADDA